MDILTQGLIGGVLARTVATNEEKKLATVIGFVAGLLADADILIRSSSDPLLNIEYHRHFTHSLIFIPVGAAIAFMILWPFLRRHITNRHLYLYCLAGYSMSGVLDALTSYGTQLFWPISNERVAFNIISIVDPVFSMILLTTLLLGLRSERRQVAFMGLVIAVIYLGLGYTQLQRAEKVALDLIAKRGHQSVQHVVKPTLANLLLWRSVYIYDDRIYVDAIRVGLFGKNTVFEGDSVEKFNLEKDMPELSTDSILYADIQRFLTFSNGFVALDPNQEMVLGDIRYSMLPVSIRPLWGIVIEKDKPNTHVGYRFFRENNREVRQSFINMLSGSCAAAVC